jgi:hypothetical protein
MSFTIIATGPNGSAEAQCETAREAVRLAMAYAGRGFLNVLVNESGREYRLPDLPALVEEARRPTRH